MEESVNIQTEVFFKDALKDLKLDANRRVLLNSIAEYMANKLTQNSIVNLNFICTHNSRRSQLAQVWGSYAAFYFKLSNVSSFSGGTEATAFFRNTVKTLQEVGFVFQIKEFDHQNPVYSISYKNGISSIIGFSKLYDHPQNKKPFIAITTCDHADENCPFIPDATERFHLPFIDPKRYDNTPEQSTQYLITNKQIAGEIHYIFKTVNSLL